MSKYTRLADWLALTAFSYSSYLPSIPALAQGHVLPRRKEKAVIFISCLLGAVTCVLFIALYLVFVICTISLLVADR